jgi:hypothetical protein
MLYELIRASIETKLNNNTDNKVFRVGSYSQLNDKSPSFLYDVRNGYRIIETAYITAMAEIDIEHQALPNQINGSATINVSFLLNGTDQRIAEADLSTLNQFIAQVVGNSEDLTDTNTYHTVWSCSGIIPNGVVGPINGTYYTEVSMSVYIEFSDTNYFGNRYTYFLGTTTTTTQILPYDGSIDRDNTENLPQRITEYEAKGGNEESFWGGKIVVYVNSFIETNILEDISSDTYDLTKKFYYQEKTNGVTKNQFWVHLKNISKPILLGEKQYISFDMFKSDYVAE